MSDRPPPLGPLQQWLDLHRLADDVKRPEAVAKRHQKGFRTARENVAAIADEGSFIEYGRLAVAAQRERKSIDELRRETPGDGVITGLCTINADRFGQGAASSALVVNDYSVLAGTQGYFHHQKIDRLLAVARERKLPVVMFAEGGGGRPGDVDVKTVNSGLQVGTFATWAAMTGVAPRIAIANGYCFAGNAALFGSADIRIATKKSFIGMAGPAMIEGGGLGRFRPDEIGPTDIQSKNGVVDLVVEDEAEAAVIARQLLGFFQGTSNPGNAPDQAPMREALPDDRRFSYRVRPILERLADDGIFVELRRDFGGAIVTGFMRLDGNAVGVLANDTRALGGAIDAAAADKAADFLELLNAFRLPVVTLCDTPGFMVGPRSEEEAAVRRMGRLFVAGARVRTPWIAVLMRKAYGLGAMAMVGGSMRRPDLCVAWPQGELGAMGLEGAVRLGFGKELEAAPNAEAKQALFDELVGKLYEKGRAVEAATYLELDGVIDPADTRDVISSAIRRVRR